MLAIGIALVAIALVSQMYVPPFAIWLVGVAAVGCWIGHAVAQENPEVTKHENRD